MSDSISAPLDFLGFFCFLVVGIKNPDCNTSLENQAQVFLKCVNVDKQNKIVSLSGETEVYILLRK